MSSQDSLFGPAPGATPLAERLRPRSLDDYLGQDELVGPGTTLRRALDEDRLHSLLLWGPPGSGKTTLARLIARATRARFEQLSAVLSGVKDVRRVMEEAAAQRRAGGERTVLFIDEIHRFNKAQQDAFLPHVERGDIVLVGATTENPSFGVIGPLLSRCRVYELQPLDDEALGRLLERALAEDELLAPRRLELEATARERILAQASGDARSALTLLEVVAEALPDGSRTISGEDVRRAARSRTYLHDRAGEEHYNLASAFIKSMRSSDPDAALYWMARALAAGTDPLFLCRRMMILAAEDVGLADPQALPLAVAAHQAFERLGLPEGEIPMAEACVYLSTAPKSNAAYRALCSVREVVREGRRDPVPRQLRNAVTGLMKAHGYGDGYRHAHDDEQGLSDMSCLPPALAGSRWYEPTARGHEREIGSRLERWRERLDERRGG
jgi:putative ATPase